MKKVLSIAGSDCSGGAGIQADLKTFSAHGVYGMSVIVLVVAENTGRVIGIQDISADMIGKQIDAVFEDIEVDAVKVGMLSTPDCIEEAAKAIRTMGCRAVIVKGGHAAGNAVDVLFDGIEICHFDTARIDTKNTHGTGCTFSSAVASQLARGMNLWEAVQKAKDYVTMAIEHSLDIGKGCGPTHHFWHLYQYGLQEGRDGGK